MNRLHALAAVLTAALASTACVSTTSVGYGDGTVTSSPVTLQFQAPPALQSPQGVTYRVTGDAGTPNLRTLDRQGMQRMAQQADVEVQITMGEPQQGEAGAMKVSGGYVPAFTMTVPFGVTIAHRGEQVATQRDSYQSMLTFKGGQTFPTEKEAIAAIDAIRTLAEKGLQKRAREEATTQAVRTADETAAALFQPRDVAFEVPVVRSAAGVDMQPCYELLADPTDTAKVSQAVGAYEQLGTDHRNQDGTPNETAAYGVLCGLAAAQLFAGDPQAAWETLRTADGFEPEGQEADQIRLVIYRQELATGVAVIPAADRQRIQQAERSASALQRMLSAPGR
ncbi:MAG: hypothetical protein AB7O97_15680 [Planctomycetota bacterium]